MENGGGISVPAREIRAIVRWALLYLNQLSLTLWIAGEAPAVADVVLGRCFVTGALGPI